MVDKLFFFVKHLKWLVLRIDWNSAGIVPNLGLPVLYVSGDQDELVPHEQTLKLHNLTKLAKFKELYVVPGGTHNDAWMVGGRTYISKLDKFIRRCIT